MDGFQLPAGTHRQLAATNNEAVLHGWIIVLAGQVSDFTQILLGGHEEHEVARKNLLVTIRTDGLAVTLDRHHVEIMSMCHTDLLQGMTHQLIFLIADFLLANRVCIVHLHAQQQQFAIVELPHLTHPTVPGTGLDVFGCQEFWIDQRLDAHVLEQFQALGLHVFVIIDTCHRMLCTQLLGQHGTRQVLAHVRSDSNEQVGTIHFSILQTLNGRRLLDQRHDVQLTAQTKESSLVSIDEHHILTVVRQHACQMSAHGTCTSNHYLHDIVEI